MLVETDEEDCAWTEFQYGTRIGMKENQPLFEYNILSPYYVTSHWEVNDMYDIGYLITPHFHTTDGHEFLCAEKEGVGQWYQCSSANDGDIIEVEGTRGVSQETPEEFTERWICLSWRNPTQTGYLWVKTDDIASYEKVDADEDGVPNDFDCAPQDDKVYGKFDCRTEEIDGEEQEVCTVGPNSPVGVNLPPDTCGDGIDNTCKLGLRGDAVYSIEDDCDSFEYKDSCNNHCLEDDGICNWVDTSTTTGLCCGDDGVDDVGSIVSADSGNYLCLSKDAVTSDTGAAVDVIVDWSQCLGEWCWASASGNNAPRSILTIKTMQESYDVVSDSKQWQQCQVAGDAAASRRFLSDRIAGSSIFGDEKKDANHFACYQEGSYYSWAECLVAEDLAGPAGERRNGLMKGRNAGDGLYTLYVGEGDRTSLTEVVIQPEDETAYYNFDTYNQLNFFFRFESGGAVISESQLTKPVDIILEIYGPQQEDGTPVLYLKKSVLADVANRPLFSSDAWMQVQTDIPNNLLLVSYIKIISSSEDNPITVKSVYLSKAGEPAAICSGSEVDARSSWLTDFDDGAGSLLNAQDMCIAQYGANAWLGKDRRDNTGVEADSANCCGNTKGEYYSGWSDGEEGNRYACWNSQAVKEGETSMNVEA